jgi:hypothetical protein
MGRHALVLDPTCQRLEILDPGRNEVLAINLPAPMATEVGAWTETPVYRHLYVLPEVDLVVLAMLGKRAFWWSLETMRSLAERDVGQSLRWTFVPAWPRGDSDARVEGTVTIVAAGRTIIKAGAQNITLKLTGPKKGDRIALLGRLWDANGVTQYARIQLADGPIVALPGVPELPNEAITTVSIVGVTPRATARTTTPLAKTLVSLQAEGLLRSVTPAMLADYVDGGVETTRDLLDAYYSGDESRMIEDGFLTHDWRFGQETDDVIAEICARLGGPPLFEQLAVSEGAIEVRDRAGTRHKIAVESLDDVIDFFNAALAKLNDPRRLIAFEDDGDQVSYLVAKPVVSKRLRELGVPLRK